MGPTVSRQGELSIPPSARVKQGPSVQRRHSPARTSPPKGRTPSGSGSGGASSPRRVAWLPPDGMTLQDWIAAGSKLGLLARSSQWWIGDWIRFGNAKWGEKYLEAARITGYDVGTLRNMAWVSGQFDLSLRSDKLSWSHYPLIAKLDPEERPSWIARAIADRLSVNDLRVELRGTSKEATGPVKETPPSSPGLEVLCPHCGHAVDIDEALHLEPTG
jgi:hypothetical protein